MSSPKIKSVVSGVTLGLLIALFGSAQTAGAQTSSEGLAAFEPPEMISADAIRVEPARSGNGAIQPLVSPNAFTDICLYRIHGSHRLIICNDRRIGANSRVFLSLSEFGARPTARIVGAARMTVHNVSPHAGGVTAWIDVEWPNDLNVRVDVLVDP